MADIEPTRTDPAAGAPPSSKMGGWLDRGATVGRYVVLDCLGTGGMGVVYAAYDPELDRKIALKILRARAASDQTAGRTRLLREAQAMARVVHPNVITVHDVGTFQDQVFVAMEYIRGATLTDWLERGEHDRAEILDVFMRAGRGLDAAHRAGLVHRDFKPDNVMVAQSGSVRVMDFGLARSTSEESEREHAPAKLSSGENPLSTPLTRTGAVMGTPAYMAPEQHLGREADERADQFSFCVALYEALYGERPFAGDSAPALALQVTQGNIRTAPKSASVPGWLRRTMVRGLQVDPQQRWPSMEALLTALASDPGRARRRALAAVAVVALVGSTVWGAARARDSQAGVCAGAETRLEGVWDGPRKQAIASAFEATGARFAATSWAGVEHALDDYAVGWTAMHRSACEATHVRGEQSGELLDLRMACLRRRSIELRALTDLFLEPDEKLVLRAVSASAKLTPVDVCADTEQLQAPIPVPDDPNVRARVEEVRERIAEATARDAAGRYREALAIAGEAADDAREIGYAPLVAEALDPYATLHDTLGDYGAAEAALHEMIQAAARGKHDRLVARGWTFLIWVTGGRQERRDEARWLAPVAAAAVAQAGDPIDLRAALAGMLCSVHVEKLEYAEGRSACESALALYEEAYGPDALDVSTPLGNLARALHGLGEYDGALAAQYRALELRERHYGSGHPQIATSLTSLCTVLADQGKYDQATPLCERALELILAAYGEDHSNVGTAVHNLGLMDRHQGRLESAAEHYRRALAIWEASLGPSHPHVAIVLDNLGGVLLQTGDPEAALAMHRRSLAISEEVFGVDHAEVGYVLVNISSALLELERPQEALDASRRALVLWEKGLAPDHPKLALALVGLGSAHLELGRPRRAIEPLERALSIRARGPGDAFELATIRFVLAQALWDAGRDRPRARELAELARTGFADAGPQGPAEAKRAQDWIASR